MAEKLYVITRQDLSNGQQAVQASHALTEFLFEHPAIASQWHASSNTLALLSVSDEESLRRLKLKARQRRLRCASFHEPDRNNELTAIALEPNAKGLLRDLALALA